MALVTKKWLVEQIEALTAGGTPSAGAKFERRMIETVLQTVINKKLKSEYFTVTLPGDETIPEGLVLASYDAVPVEKYKGLSRAKLPAMPISLRRGMGIYFVGPAISNLNLSTPSISSLTIDASNINLMWGAIPYGVSYLLERALDSLFTAGLVSIYFGANTSFIDSRLAAQTQYFYRLSVLAPGFTTSSYAFTNATTNIITNTFPYLLPITL